MARIRSPNYPQIGLGAAIERVRMIYKSERQNRIDRDTAVKLMGFGGYNGASAGVLSAINKYGLLIGDAGGEREMKVSDLAVRILVPHDDGEKAEAIAEAAGNPPLFKELAERWPDNPPSDPSLRSYLTRRGFADSALEAVIRSYEETHALVRETATQYKDDPEPSEETEAVEVHQQEAVRSGGLEARNTGVPTAKLTTGPGLELVRSTGGYIVKLTGAVLTQGHVDEVVTLLTALKASMPIEAAVVEPIVDAPTQQ